MKFEIIADDRTPIERKVHVRIDSDSIERFLAEALAWAINQIKPDGFRERKAPKYVAARQIGSQ